MTIIVRPLTGSPPAPRFARPLARLAVLTCERPRWGLALSLPKRSELVIITSWATGTDTTSEHKNSFPMSFRAGVYL